MRKFFIVLYTLCFLGLSALHLLEASNYDEYPNYYSYFLLFAVPYVYLLMQIWNPQKSQTKKIPLLPVSMVAVVLCIIAMIFPYISSFFLYGPDVRGIYYEGKTIFHRGVYEGVYRFFNNATTGEVILFELYAVMLIHSAFAATISAFLPSRKSNID